MAVAGRVAIVPKGDYDVSAVYKKLDLVRYNQNAYVAKKPSTGIEPTDEEYWMLMIENVSATDLTELKEKMEGILNGTLSAQNSNNLGNNPPSYYATSQSVTDIINGTTPAGNALKLNGLTAEEFVSNKNLLIDPNFELYFDGVKKWKFSQGDGTVESAETGATITSSATSVQFRQSTENMYFSEDGYITGSLEFGDATNLENVYLVIYIDNVWSGNISLSKANDGIIDIKRIVTKGMHSVGLGIYMGVIDAKVNLKWLKLELGSIATPFIPPNKEVEKLKCGATDFRKKTETIITTLPTPPTEEGDYRVHDGDDTFPYTFGHLSIRIGALSEHQEWIAIYKTTGDDVQIYYNFYHGTDGWKGWRNISDGGNADTVDGFHVSEFAKSVDFFSATDFSFMQNRAGNNHYRLQLQHGVVALWESTDSGATWTKKSEWSTNYLPLDGSVPMSGALGFSGGYGRIVAGGNFSQLTATESTDTTDNCRGLIVFNGNSGKATSSMLQAFDIVDGGAPTYYTVLHTGNSAAVVKSATAPSDTAAVWVDTTNKATKIYKDGAWTALT